MANGEGFSSIKAPLFDGTNYAFWSLRMQTYLSALIYDICESVKSMYITSNTPPTDPTKKKLYENDTRAKNAIMCGLVENELVKIMSCKSTKEIWDKLKSIHEGDDKVKEEKL